MRPIRVLTPNFELLGEIDTYQSLIFTQRWHGVGEFQLVVNRHMAYADTLQKGNIIWLHPDPQKVGIILYREIGLDESGKASENWQIKGLTLEGITRRRVTVPPAGRSHDRINSNAETVMKHYISSNIINPADPDRVISQVQNAPNQGRGPQVIWQSRYKQLDEELEKISYLTGLGWYMALDYENKKWVFDVAEGSDRTADQADLPPVIFSPEFGVIRTQGFTDSEFNLLTYAYVGGQGEGADRRIVTVGGGVALDRIEAFVDARDIGEESEDGDPIPEPEVIAQLEQRGNQVLAEHDTELFFEAQITVPVTDKDYLYGWIHPAQAYAEEKIRLVSPFVYGEDWFLGDLVTVQNKDWGITLNARVTEITEIYEPDGFRLEAAFGNSVPTFIEKIKQSLSQLENEVRR